MHELLCVYAGPANDFMNERLTHIVARRPQRRAHVRGKTVLVWVFGSKTSAESMRKRLLEVRAAVMTFRRKGFLGASAAASWSMLHVSLVSPACELEEEPLDL